MMNEQLEVADDRIQKLQHINWNSAYPGEGDKCYKLGVLQLKNFKFSPLGKQYQIAKEINHIQTFYPEELKKSGRLYEEGITRKHTNTLWS